MIIKTNRKLLTFKYLVPFYIPKTTKIKDIRHSAENIKTFVFDIKGLNAEPGQFVNLWLPQLDEKPFSVADDTGIELSLAISKIGPFTAELFKLKKGDMVGLRGPYGKGFTIHKNKNVVLVGGGFGMAPLHFLGKRLQDNGSIVYAAIGARTSDYLVYVNECRESGFKTHIATDDGSLGIKGFSTDLLEKIISQEKINAVQTCGPEKMMEKVAGICQKHNINCEISLERYMKCGFGICGQCVCGGKRMCIDGPVVTGEWALAQDEFAKFKRGPEGEKINL